MSARDQILGKIGSQEAVKHPGTFVGASEDFDFRASLEVVGARVVSPEDLGWFEFSGGGGTGD
jgi:hypothetical protein